MHLQHEIAEKNFCTSISPEQQTILLLYLTAYSELLKRQLTKNNVEIRDTLLKFAKLKRNNRYITDYEYNQVELQQLENSYEQEHASQNYREAIPKLKNRLSVNGDMEIEKLDVKELPDVLDADRVTECIYRNNSQVLNDERQRKQAAYNRYTSRMVTFINGIMSLTKVYLDLAAKRNVLLNSMRQWKKHYLLVAPISGELEYLGFWRENVFVQSTQELFTILPDKNKSFGEVYIPLLGAGKVKVGQLANIKLADYPYDEYGLIQGRVKSISKLTNKISTSEGTAETYLVVFSFPNGLTTNYGEQLRLNFESKGSIEIITKHKQLIERMFDNLKLKMVS